MASFGWSYPPGCTGTPYDDEALCSCCGRDAGSCICPECPECGIQGDPRCYQVHGLRYTPEQYEGQQRLLEQLELEDDRSYADQLETERGMESYD